MTIFSNSPRPMMRATRVLAAWTLALSVLGGGQAEQAGTLIGSDQQTAARHTPAKKARKAPPRKPPRRPKAPKFLTFADDVPQLARQRVNESLADRQRLGLPMPCRTLNVSVQDDPDQRSWFGFNEFVYPSHYFECFITYDVQAADDPSWYGHYSIRHEVAHAVAVDRDIVHGAFFRGIEAQLLEPVGLRLVYGTRGEYPASFWYNGSCVKGCT
jgi:hypothetical protein